MFTSPKGSRASRDPGTQAVLQAVRMGIVHLD